MGRQGENFRVIANGYEVYFGVVENVLELMVIVALFCDYTKKKTIVHLKRVNLRRKVKHRERS